MPEVSVSALERKAQPDHWVYHEGEFRRYGDAHLGLLTHALHYGTGCFEGIRAYWSARQRRLNVFRLAEHFQRIGSGTGLVFHQNGKFSCHVLPPYYSFSPGGWL